MNGIYEQEITAMKKDSLMYISVVFFSVVFFPGSLTVVHRPLTTSLYYLPVQPSRNKKGRKIFYRLNS